MTFYRGADREGMRWLTRRDPPEGKESMQIPPKVVKLLRIFAEHPSLFFHEDEIARARRLSKRVEYVRIEKKPRPFMWGGLKDWFVKPPPFYVVVRCKFKSGTEIRIAEDGSIACHVCGPNCLHSLALAFYLRERGEI